MSEQEQSKNLGGRPPFEITQKVIEQAESYAAQGLTLKQIADCLGISYQTLNEKRKEFPEFSDAIEIGKSKGIAFVTNALFKKAKAGDIHAVKFFLTNRDNKNWKERRTNEVTGADGADLIPSVMDTSGLSTNTLKELLEAKRSASKPTPSDESESE